MFQLAYSDLENDTEQDVVPENRVSLVAHTAPVHLPHPIPYQGSKRLLAPQILSVLNGRAFHRFYEPFAGSAAMTIAANYARIADKYVLGDILAPLIDIWNSIISAPYELANVYEQVWYEQLQQDNDYYNRIREQYNTSPQSSLLLYLLARCVKNAPRFNRQGQFNQSHDKRRLGMHPNKMRQELLEASILLHNRTQMRCGDFMTTLIDATPEDIVYLDPPYEGTSTGSDRRYYQSLERIRLLEALTDLNERHIPFLLSYDGRCGEKTYGEALPTSLNVTRLELHAGRSSQSTLNGGSDVTVESLYVSNSLLDGNESCDYRRGVILLRPGCHS